MEKLHTYLKSRRIKGYEFAEALDCHQSMVSKLIRGHARPNLDMAIAIHDLTGGEVSPLDWRLKTDAASSYPDR